MKGADYDYTASSKTADELFDFIAAIVKEWLRRDCEDDVEMVAGIIEACVRPREGFCEK